MDVRISSEIHILRDVLDKFLAKEQFDNYEETVFSLVLLCNNLIWETYQVFDALVALKKLDITYDVLKKTKIGMSVNSIKKKYTTQPAINNLAKELVSNWKKVYEDSQSQTPTSVGSQTSTETRETVQVSKSNGTGATTPPESPASSIATTTTATSVATAKPAPVASSLSANTLLSDLEEGRRNVFESKFNIKLF
jgi:hypothetical protein